MSRNQKELLSAKTYQLIKDDIVSCVFDPGQFIAQANLVEKYNVGLTPVREALRQLTQEGFVLPVPRMGYIVSTITHQDVQEIYELRLILETASVKMAAKRGAQETLQKILQSANFTYVYKDRQSYTLFLKQNADFHISIAAASENQRLVLSISKTMDELNRVFHLGLDLKDSAEEMRTDHLMLAEALSKRDPDLAEKLVQAEILRSRARVMEALKKYPVQSPSPAHLMSLNFRKSQ
jgi:DNA-binding GntR family transcriptional regulator